MSDLQGAEAEALISEISATVCNKDPRTGQQRRVDGLLALLYGEHALACRCELAEECSAAGVAEEIAPRRGHLLNILVDVETLLGLSSTPATLPDGTALDPDLVRMLAQDARWQAILTELVEVLEVSRGGSTGSATERTGVVDNPVAEQSDPGSNGTRDDGPESPSRCFGGSSGAAEFAGQRRFLDQARTRSTSTPQGRTLPYAATSIHSCARSIVIRRRLQECSPTGTADSRLHRPER